MSTTFLNNCNNVFPLLRCFCMKISNHIRIALIVKQNMEGLVEADQTWQYTQPASHCTSLVSPCTFSLPSCCCFSDEVLSWYIFCFGTIQPASTQTLPHLSAIASLLMSAWLPASPQAASCLLHGHSSPSLKPMGWVRAYGWYVYVYLYG